MRASRSEYDELKKSYEIMKNEKGIWDWGKVDVRLPIDKIFRGKLLRLYEDKWILIYYEVTALVVQQTRS